MPDEFRDALPCPDRQGVTRHGFVGPDYTVLVPAARRRDTAELQRRIGRLTWYFICTRPRIRATPAEFYVADRHLHMGFSISLDGGGERVLTAVAPEPTNADTVTVEPGGVDLVLRSAGCHETRANASMLAQVAVTPHPYEPTPLDLEVRYIGRARGELANRCALDRLDEHKQYQRILEEVQAPPYENREIVLLLCSGTTFHISSASDHPPSDAETVAEYAAVERTRELLTEPVRVDAVEALLINLFKPPHNTHYVGELDPRWEPFKKCRQAGLTGLTLVMSTDDLHCGLYTGAQHAAQHFHHSVCF